MNETVKHHRINEQLFEYWDSLRQGRAMPLETDINIDKLRDIWGHCFLVNVHADRFAYSYLGPELIDAYGDDITGREIAETLLEPHPTSLFTSFKDVIRSAAPKTDESEFVNSRGNQIKYRSCILPLGSKGHTSVAFLLGGMKWKAY